MQVIKQSPHQAEMQQAREHPLISHIARLAANALRFSQPGAARRRESQVELVAAGELLASHRRPGGSLNTAHRCSRAANPANEAPPFGGASVAARGDYPVSARRRIMTLSLVRALTS